MTLPASRGPPAERAYPLAPATKSRGARADRPLRRRNPLPALQKGLRRRAPTRRLRRRPPTTAGPPHPPLDRHLLGVGVQSERLAPFPGLVARRHRVAHGPAVGLGRSAVGSVGLRFTGERGRGGTGRNTVDDWSAGGRRPRRPDPTSDPRTTTATNSPATPPPAGRCHRHRGRGRPDARDGDGPSAGRTSSPLLASSASHRPRSAVLWASLWL